MLKKIYLLFLLISAQEVIADSVQEEMTYYRFMKIPVQNLLLEVAIYSGEHGTLFRNASVEYESFKKFPQFYENCIGMLEQALDSVDIETEDVLVTRLEILKCIRIVVEQLNAYPNALVLDEKFEKILLMNRPRIGYEGTIDILRKFQNFIEKQMVVIDTIYQHELRIIEVSIRGKMNDVSESLGLLLQEEHQFNENYDVKNILCQALDRFDSALILYNQKLSACPNEVSGYETEGGVLVSPRSKRAFSFSLLRRKSINDKDSPLVSPRISVSERSKDNELPADLESQDRVYTSKKHEKRHKKEHRNSGSILSSAGSEEKEASSKKSASGMQEKHKKELKKYASSPRLNSRKDIIDHSIVNINNVLDSDMVNKKKKESDVVLMRLYGSHE
jgi:tetratricopeptide (TPR) repeat protein